MRFSAPPPGEVRLTKGPPPQCVSRTGVFSRSRELRLPPRAGPKCVSTFKLTAIKDIYNAEDIDKAQVAVEAFEVDFGAKHPKAVAKVVDDLDRLLEFYKYPAEHWIHLRTTNPIGSTSATVRLRTKVTKGPGSRGAGIASAYKLIDAAQAAGAPHLVAWSVPALSSTRASCSNDPSTSHPNHPRQSLKRSDRRLPETMIPPGINDVSQRRPASASNRSAGAAERTVVTGPNRPFDRSSSMVDATSCRR